MGDEDRGEPFVGTVRDAATDYEGVLPSDTISLSDSDSEDLGFPGDAEVDTISFEEPLPSDDADCRSDESGEPLPKTQKSFVQPFHLKGMSTSFSQRSQSIFDCLEGAAKQAMPSMAEDNIIDGRFKRPLPPSSLSSKVSTENLGRQSKPSPCSKSSPAIPDYVAHPERWTKYSLDDVSESSDKTNRLIAMDFLEGLKKKKGEQNTSSEAYIQSFNQDPSSSGAGRIVFTKPTKASFSRKRAAIKEDEEAKAINADSESKEKSVMFKTNDEEKKAGLDSLDGGVTKVEHEESPKLEEADAEKEAGVDSSKADEGTAEVVMGFHGSKKRSRKHFRPKASCDEEEEEP
uniref:U5 small nuclear ribonucleoprotein TSSC4 n=1 Tax=Salvator merianae TaxID=96440 RepID=A0A8D0C7M9_SALMN